MVLLYGLRMEQMLPTDVPQKNQHSRDEGKEVAHGHARPDAVQPHELREHQQAGQQVEQLARQRHKDADLGHADALEEVADDNLCPHEGEDGHTDAHAAGGHVDKRLVRREDRSHRVGKKLADEETARGDTHTRRDAQAQHLLHTVQPPRAEVIARNGLHAHRQAQYHHDVEHQQAVDDAVGTDSHVAPVALQAVVDDDDNGAGRDVHQERRHADGEDTSHDAPLHALETISQADGVRTLEKVVEYPQHSDELRNDRGQSRAPYAPTKLENEDGSKDDVAHHGGERRQHGFLRMARGTHDVVQPDHSVSDGRPQQDDLHEIAGVGQCFAAGTKEAQDGVEEDECQSAEHHGIDQAEHQRVAQHLVHALHVLLSQADGGNGGTACRNQVAEGGRQIHQREGDGQARNSHGAYAVADEDAVDDVVERHDGHADDGGDGILYEQLPDAFGT